MPPVEPFAGSTAGPNSQGFYAILIREVAWMLSSRCPNAPERKNRSCFAGCE